MPYRQSYGTPHYSEYHRQPGLPQSPSWFTAKQTAAFLGVLALACAVTALALLFRRSDINVQSTDVLTADQIAVLQQSCLDRGLFYDDGGICYSADPNDLAPEQRVRHRVAAAVPTPDRGSRTLSDASAAPTAAPALPAVDDASGAAPRDEVRTATLEADAVVVEPFNALPPAPSEWAEVHLIGTEHEQATVKVVALTPPVVLVLSSHSPTDWMLSLDDAADVEFVVLSGFHRQRVLMEDPDRVPIYYASHDDGGSFDYFAITEDDSAPRYRAEFDEGELVCTAELDEDQGEQRYVTGLDIVEQLLGERPRGLQGHYAGSEYLVTDQTRDASLRATFERGRCYEGMAGHRPL